MKFWARQQARAMRNDIIHQEILSKDLDSDYHKKNPNITKNEIKTNVTKKMEQRVARIERKQLRHRKK